MSRPKPREPQAPRRQGGKILPAKFVRRSVWAADQTCALCGRGVNSRSWMTTEAPSGKWFCGFHSPKRAAVALASYSNGSIENVGGPYTEVTRPGQPPYRFTRYGSLRNKNLPDRATCEKILRLAGMAVVPRPPAKPKKKPRDRRYVR